MINKKATIPFPTDFKNFAKSLHFHSPSAYEFMRQSFLKCLPSTQTLNKWLTTTEYTPGISEEMIKKISKIVEEQSPKEVFLNITFDEMSIKQHKEWNCATGTWKGLVDLGGQLTENYDDGTEKLATKALVFLLVNINGSFKAPIAHYLINSLNGLEKSILLKDLLIKLHEYGIKVISVTFDGDKAHKTACELLGAHLNYCHIDFKPSFPHPTTQDPVYIFFDPCHCLKLIRNYFANKGPLIYDNKDTIDWSYVVKLNEKQQNEKLHLATKIRNRHIHFQNEKMKVFLAAQTLSNSTSVALNFLEYQLKEKDFIGSNPTALFCKNINDTFDILNVKSKYSNNPGRSSVTINSLPELKIKIDYLVSYIEKLEIYEKPKKNKLKSGDNLKIKKKITESPTVCTGFVGFIICLKNIYDLAYYLLHNKYIDYLLSYKLSQDHIEMFFSLIRRMNGFNNNPTTIQYLSAIRKLLSNRLNVCISSSANCAPLDNTLLVTIDNTSKNESVKPNGCFNVTNENETSETSENCISANKNQCTFDHEYCTMDGSWSNSEYRDEIIAYISGSIVHYLKRSIHCTDCLKLIDGSSNCDKTKKIVLKKANRIKK